MGGCLLTEPVLLSFVPSAGTLSPNFAPATTTYTLTLVPGATTLSLTAAVQYPSHATITVAGIEVLSGASTAIPIGLTPQPVTVVITTDGGASATYTVVARRTGPTYVKASNTSQSDSFGAAVAISADGLTLAVGAPGEDSNSSASQGNNDTPGAGAVYVFARVGTTWSQQAYLKASNAGSGDGFGMSVSLSGDGSTLVVGAPFEDSDGSEANIDAGATYVFVRAGMKWSQQSYLKASNGENGVGDGPWDGDHFGEAVAISGDGMTVAVGASSEDSNSRSDPTNNSMPNSGAVYVFVRDPSSWSQHYLKPTVPSEGDRFGCSLSLSANGSILAVGAYHEDSSATDPRGAPDSGAVFVFARSGATWESQANLKAKSTLSATYFGGSVALAGDGATLAVYAPGEGGSTGVAHVFVRSGTKWTQDADIKGAHAEAGDAYGLAAGYSTPSASPSR